jgi:hypothetical protein
LKAAGLGSAILGGWLVWIGVRAGWHAFTGADPAGSKMLAMIVDALVAFVGSYGVMAGLRTVATITANTIRGMSRIVGLVSWAGLQAGVNRASSLLPSLDPKLWQQILTPAAVAVGGAVYLIGSRWLIRVTGVPDPAASASHRAGKTFATGLGVTVWLALQAILVPLITKLRGEPSLINTLASTVLAVLGGRFAYRRSLRSLGTAAVPREMEPQMNADERR